MAASLSGVFNVQELADGGVTLVGGRLYTYAQGTTTFKAAYTDASASVPQTYTNDGLGGQYIALNARGELPAPLYLTTGSYDIALKRADGSTVWTRRADPVNDNSALADGTSATTGAGMVAFNYSLGYAVGTLGRWLKDLLLSAGAGFIGIDATVSYQPSTVGGAVFSTIFGDGSDKSSALTAANALGYPIRIKGVLIIGTPTTITVPILDTMSQIFSTSSSITINNGLPVRPEWWGSSAGNIRLAVNALPTGGGTILLEEKTYPPSYNTSTSAKILSNTCVAGVDYLAKTGIKIVGRALPKFNASNTGLEGGTVVQGFFHVYASGFQIDNVGFDSGSLVVTALYGGVAQDAFFFAKPNHLVGNLVTDVQIGSVIGLGSDPAAAGHGVLIEGIDGGRVEYAEGRKALHGVVVKSLNMTIGTLIGRETTLESVILKSDDYAPCGGIVGDHAEASSLDGTLDPGHGFLIDGVTSGLGKVVWRSVKASNKANGFTVRNNGNIVGDVQVGMVQTDTCPIGVYMTNDVRRVKIGSVIANNSTYGVQIDANVTFLNTIDNITVTNATNGIQLGGRLEVGNLDTDTISGLAVNYFDVAARLVLGSHRERSVAGFWTLSASFSGTWVNEGTAGNPVLSLTLDGGRVRLTGAIKGGGAATVTNPFSVQIRPATNVRVTNSGFNGATLAPVDVQISTAGVVTIPNFASAPTSIFLNADWPIPT